MSIPRITRLLIIVLALWVGLFSGAYAAIQPNVINQQNQNKGKFLPQNSHQSAIKKDIKPGSLQIVSPATGGTVWYSGSTQTISWNGSGPGSKPLGPVEVTLWKGGLLSATIASSASGTSVTYQVPQALESTSSYLLRVTSKNHAGLQAETYLVIFANKSVSFTSPQTKQTWQAGTQQTVRWTYAGTPGPIKLTLEGDGPALVLGDNIPSGAGSHTFTVPPPTNYYANFTLYARTAGEGRILGLVRDMKISWPEIALTAPVANQNLPKGTASVITWKQTPSAGPVSISLIKAGQYQAFKTIAASVPAAQGSFSWVPEASIPEGKYYIRIMNDPYGVWGDSGQFNLTAPAPPADPILTGATATFTTTLDKKDSATSVSVSVKNKTSGKSLAYASNAAVGSEYKANTQSTLNLSLYPNIRKSDCANLGTTVSVKASGSDTWSFRGTVTLKFADGSQLTTGSTNEHIMHSQQSQPVSVDLNAPAGHVYSQGAPPPASGMATSLLTKCTNINDPRYSMNYYNAGSPIAYQLPDNAKITSVKNASQSHFILWLYDKGQVASPDVPLSPGQVTNVFNGKRVKDISWGAAMSAPYPNSAKLEVQWSAN